MKENNQINEVPVNSIFEQPWWLDVVSNNNWKSIELINNNKIYARLPYVEKNVMGFKVITVPQLTQSLGIYIEGTGAKRTKSLERNKKIINEIVDKLPEKSNVVLYLDSNCNYVLPFTWKGFNLTPTYTYRFDDLENLDAIWKGFKENIKTDIRKASKKVEIRDDMPVDTIIELNKKTFARQKRKYPIDDDMIKKLDKVLIEHNARHILTAVDSEGRIHGAAYFVYDSNRCYYLLGGEDSEFRNSGAGSLLVWEGIKFASKVSKAFDFEGSNIENIERFFRAFGGEPKIIMKASRLNWFLALAEFLKPKIKKIIGYEQ